MFADDIVITSYNKSTNELYVDSFIALCVAEEY